SILPQGDCSTTLRSARSANPRRREEDTIRPPSFFLSPPRAPPLSIFLPLPPPWHAGESRKVFLLFLHALFQAFLCFDRLCGKGSDIDQDDLYGNRREVPPQAADVP